jgi:Mrr restriction endonuclease-like protein
LTLEEPSWEDRVQAMMLPALRLASRHEINSKILVKAIIEDKDLREELSYTNEELTERPPGAAVPPARNNAQWTIVHLQRAKLLEKVRREAYAITDRGHDSLAKNPPKITFDDLRQFEKYRQLRKAKVITPGGEVEVAVPDEHGDSEEAFPSKAEAFPQVAIAGEPEARQSIRLQAEIAEIGAKMGFRIWVPAADRAKVLEIVQPAQKDSFLEILPLNYDENTLDTIRQIDVLWLKGRSTARAFEVEHTTAIYSVGPSTKYANPFAHRCPG